MRFCLNVVPSTMCVILPASAVTISMMIGGRVGTEMILSQTQQLRNYKSKTKEKRKDYYYKRIS